MIPTPYLLFLGDAKDQLSAKVAQGIKDWRPENAVGQLRLAGCGADIGLTDLTLEPPKRQVRRHWSSVSQTVVVSSAKRGKMS